MFRTGCARTHTGMEDRGDRIGREGQGEEVLVKLPGVPADALAVPAPVQPQRDRGRLEDIRGGAVAGARHNTRESQHVLQREPHARPEGDADVLLDRVRHLPQRGAGLHKRTPPREAVQVQATRHLRRRLDHHPACVLVHRLGEAQAEEGRSEGPHGRERREQAAALLRLRQGEGPRQQEGGRAVQLAEGRRHRIGNAVFAGFRENVPEVCGIAKRRFADRWRRESSHATENGIS